MDTTAEPLIPPAVPLFRLHGWIRGHNISVPATRLRRTFGRSEWRCRVDPAHSHGPLAESEARRSDVSQFPCQNPRPYRNLPALAFIPQVGRESNPRRN